VTSGVYVVADSFRRGVLTSTVATEQTMLTSLQRVFTYLALTEVRLTFLNNNNDDDDVGNSSLQLNSIHLSPVSTTRVNDPS